MIRNWAKFTGPSSITSGYNLRDALKEQPLNKASVFLPKDRLETAQMREIPFASAKCMQRVSSDKWLVVDCIPCDRENDIDLATKDIRELARKLSSVDSIVFGVLQCRGAVRVMESGGNRPFSFDLFSTYLMILAMSLGIFEAISPPNRTLHLLTVLSLQNRYLSPSAISIILDLCTSTSGLKMCLGSRPRNLGPIYSLLSISKTYVPQMVKHYG